MERATKRCSLKMPVLKFLKYKKRLLTALVKSF